MELSEYKFKKCIWDNKNYFRNIYINNNKFFMHKRTINKPSDYFYIELDDLKDWASVISKNYTPWNNDKEQLIKDLLECRKGQYSNGTLFSSSRLIAEIFYNTKNRLKLLKWLKLDSKYKPCDFTWTLEYRIPIFGNNDLHPAQLDLAIENDYFFIGIESKMKEIYKKHYDNDFELRYRDSEIDLLKEFEPIFKITKKRIKKDGKSKDVYRMSLDGEANNNFYYKQQICHLLGMREKQSKENSNKKFIFLNFVFDIKDISGCENLDGANIRYKMNETRVAKVLIPYFDKTGIKYKGLLSQKDLFAIK